MESDIFGVKKCSFKSKSNPSDGIILQVHHTVCSNNRELKRLRFLSLTFSTDNERFACSDHRGNVFIFDMLNCMYWNLSRNSSGSVIAFAPCKKHILLVATMDSPFNVLLVHTEINKVEHKLQGHKCKVKKGSFSAHHKFLITASIQEAIIWELNNCTKCFKLNICEAKIKDISYAPVSNNIVISFEGDIIHIWRQKSLESECIKLTEEFDNANCYAFTVNGRCMVLGISCALSAHDTITWECIKKIDLKHIVNTGVKHMCFLPQPMDGGSNNILAILSNQCDVFLIDLEKSLVLYALPVETSNFYRILASPNGKYLACIYNLGEINIHNSAILLRKSNIKCEIKLPLLVPKLKTHSQKQCDTVKSGSCSKYKLKEVEKKMSQSLSEDRLHSILGQFCQYPEKHRLTIWKELLHLPKNHDAYCDLLTRPIHPVHKDLEKRMTMDDKMLLKQTKKLLSLLTHWNPDIGNLEYLHLLVFPFVKILHHDPLFCFEAVITILINFCQFWFEFTPLPPTNILILVESILEEQDCCLFKHFRLVGLTSQIYAYSLMKCLFSDVFSASEWLQLWDHILSNEPSFILMALVAYSIIHRNTLRNYYNIDQFQEFYSSYKSTNMKAFIKKSYSLLKDTSSHIHPRQYLKLFTPIDKGLCYSLYNFNAPIAKIEYHAKSTNVKKK